MIKLLCLVILMVLLCMGCATEPYYYTSTFDTAQAERMMRPGRNTIVVNTFTKDPNDGEITTCASLITTLVPATERAMEYVKFAYNSVEGGQVNTDSAMLRGRRIKNPDPDFSHFMAKQVCDSAGFATFNKVGDGTFYVFSSTPRNPYSYMYAGKIYIKGGETKTVVLHGEYPKIANPGMTYRKWERLVHGRDRDRHRGRRWHRR